MLTWYRGRPAKSPRWHIRANPLEPYEQRLKQFLERTVQPCLRLIVAAVTADESEAQRLVAMVEGVARDGEVSHRVHYALACWYARDAGRDDSAVEHLSTALANAPRDRSRELAEWSVRDPALADLRERQTAEFDAIVGKFRPGSTAPREGTPLPDAVKEKLRVGTSANLEVLACALEWPAWMNGNRPVTESPTDQMLHTICAFLNTVGGTLVIGAVERSDKAPPGEPVGNWVLVGIDHEMDGNWDSYADRLRKAIANHIYPAPQLTVEIAQHWVGERTLALLTVERGSRNYFACRFGTNDDGEFWGRANGKTTRFAAQQIEDFRSKLRTPAAPLHTSL
jgi:hypothetical protein